MSRDEEGGDSATRPIGRIAAVQPSSSLRVPERWVVHCQGKMDNNNNNNNNETRTWADDLVQAIWRPVVFGLGVGIPLLYIVRTRVIGKRYPTAGQVPPEAFANRQVIKGYVVSVGDSDNFRLYHTPGFGWGWLRKVPTKQKELKDQTIAIRLAGIDAPEGAHFGMPAQKMSAEALAFLKSLLLHRNVKVQLLSRDQYNRAVAMTFVRKPPFYRLKNVSVEMCRAGMASIYTAKGYQYGDCLKELEKAQARAKLLKKGIWSLTDYVSPGSHKAKHLRGSS